MSTNLQFEILNFKKEKGQTMFELIVALGVGVLVITAVVKMATVSVKNAVFAKSQAEATRYAQEAIEWLRLERNKDPVAFETRSNKTWCLTTYTNGNLVWPATDGACSSSSLIASKYTREVLLTSQTVGGAPLTEARMTTSWTDANGKHQSYLGVRLSDNKFVLVLTSPVASPSPVPSPIPSPVPSPSPPPANLVNNGGFESGDGAWSWTFIPVGGSSVSVTSGGAHSGNNSLMLDSLSSGVAAMIVLTSDAFTVQPNTNYCASVWTKTGGNTNSGSISVVVNSSSGSRGSWNPSRNSPDWQKSQLGISSQDSSSLYYQITVTGVRNKEYIVYFDDVSLVQGNCP